MKRKLVLVNLLLAALTCLAGWKLRDQYLADQRRAAALRNQKVKVPVPPPVAAAPQVDPFTGASYADVAQKNLFSKDRNPNIIIDPPPAPVVKPPKKMPPLPIVFGVMGLPSGMTAMMADRPGGGIQGMHTGETMGEFKILAITAKDITFDWDGQKIDKKLEELRDRPDAPQTAAPAPAAAAAPANAAEAAAQPNAAPVKPTPKDNVTIGDKMKSCQPGDKTPAGTVIDGYKKVVEATPFGEACRWYATN